MRSFRRWAMAGMGEVYRARDESLDRHFFGGALG